MRIILLITLLASALAISAQQPADEFKPSGKVTTQVFGDYYYVLKADTGINTLSQKVALTNTNAAALNKPKDMNGFRFRRANIGYEYTAAPNFVAYVKVEADELSLASDGKTSFYLKDAYFKWGISENSYLYVGLQPTFAFDLNEQMIGLRYIEKPALDLRGLVSSRDLGFGLRGKFGDESNLNYSLLITNNSSTKPVANKDKRLYGNLDYKLTNGIDIMVYADYLAKTTTGTTNKNEFLTGFFLGIKKEKFSAGVEGFYKLYHNDFKNSSGKLEDESGIIASAFINGKFNNSYGYLARYDYYNPSNKTSGDKRNFVILGLTYFPLPNVTLSPNVQVETYEKTNVYSPLPSIWARITFNWVFK